MLSKDEQRRVDSETRAHIAGLSDDALRKAAVDVFVRRKGAPDGDEREKLEIMDRLYTEAMIQRKLTV